MRNDFLSSWGKLRAPLAAIVLVVAIVGGWLAAPGGDAAGVAKRRSGLGADARAEGAAVTGRPHPSARTDSQVSRSRQAAKPAADEDPRAMFKGLGAWIDLYDFGLDPFATARTLAANGVRTLYLQTGHSYSDAAIDPRVGAWLVAAHHRGIKVVGWYLPSYKRWRQDVQRTAAIKDFWSRGHQFDGIGIDIENRTGVPNVGVWRNRVVAQFRDVRELVGDDYPLAAIPPTPLQMRLIPSHWGGFPWKALAKDADAFLLMSYWSDRRGCPRIRRHCPYEFTRDNVRLTRKLTGDPDALVHVIGGIGDRIHPTQLWSFARGALDAGANGASIYDVATTKRSFWQILRNLRDLD